MVTTIICSILWIPDILKELCNVLYESVLKAYFSSILVLFQYPSVYLQNFMMIG
jgi:hypothetical protein